MNRCSDQNLLSASWCRWLFARLRDASSCACAICSSLVVLLALLTADISYAEGYTLDTGDVLRVSVLGEPSYPLEVVIDDAGSISLPLLGEIPARGFTPGALSQAIQLAFQQQKLILEPFVKVEIGQHRPFFIAGAVANPGSYPFQPGITVRHALAIAGGFRPSATRGGVPALEIADLRSSRANLTLEEYRLNVQLARLNAENRQDKSFVAPSDPPIELGPSLIREIVASEQAQLEARLAAFKDEISYFEASLVRARKEADMIAVAREEREKTATIQLKELEALRAMRKQGLITNTNILTMERAQTSYRADLAQSELQQTQKQQDMMNLESEIRRKRQSHEIELIAKIQDTQVELGKVQSQIRSVADKLLFLFSYGEQRTFDDLQGSVRISIFRRDQKSAHTLLASENTEVKPGDVIEVSVEANKAFYAPETLNSSTMAAPDGTGPGMQPSAVIGQ
ncbi:polysaccharide biosynthesis/export family protein [Pseudaminobacter sp. 19-2017]|uniref:Polysaccharide biosynthesis/export family protein n=1 Tax=Pseudaminobacter soli (ex Zhang et al. 2022) TaxID=2831468 RepID=A0A942I4L9_9HYPH|nr:polysaccharide biosynthesis/export family protein [Pseudaminobacter soli]